MRVEQFNQSDFLTIAFQKKGLFLVRDHWIEGVLCRFEDDAPMELWLYNHVYNAFSYSGKEALNNLKLYVAFD